MLPLSVPELAFHEAGLSQLFAAAVQGAVQGMVVVLSSCLDFAFASAHVALLLQHCMCTHATCLAWGLGFSAQRSTLP